MLNLQENSHFISDLKNIIKDTIKYDSISTSQARVLTWHLMALKLSNDKQAFDNIIDSYFKKDKPLHHRKQIPTWINAIVDYGVENPDKPLYKGYKLSDIEGFTNEVLNSREEKKGQVIFTFPSFSIQKCYEAILKLKKPLSQKTITKNDREMLKEQTKQLNLIKALLDSDDEVDIAQGKRKLEQAREQARINALINSLPEYSQNGFQAVMEHVISQFVINDATKSLMDNIQAAITQHEERMKKVA